MMIQQHENIIIKKMIKYERQKKLFKYFINVNLAYVRVLFNKSEVYKFSFAKYKR